MFCSLIVFVYHIICAKGTSDELFVMAGTTAIFTCPFRSSNDDIIWRGPPKLSFLSKNEIVIAYSTRSKRITITGNFSAGEYNMELMNFTKTDEGLYICDTIENGKGLQHKFLASLAKKPSTIGNKSDFIFQTKAKEGANIKIFVKSFEKPVVTWSDMTVEGKRGVWTIRRLKIMVFELLSVIIPENEHQFGKYKLRIRNYAGSIDTSVEIVSASVAVSPRQIVCEMTKTINITCVLHKDHFDPSFRNSWLHIFNGEVIRELSGNILDNMSSLSVTFCVYKDSGNYTCKWESTSEEYSTVASVIVESRPILARKDVVIYDDTLLLKVEFVSRPTPDNISWYKNNAIVNKNDIHTNLYDVKTELAFYGKNISMPGLLSKLELHKHLNYSNGSYSCIIGNAFGYIDVSFNEKDIVVAIKRNDEQNLSRSKTDVLTAIWTSVYTGSSFVLILSLIGIIGIVKKAKRQKKQRISPSYTTNESQHYYDDAESERQNDVHDFPSDTYENMSDSEYEEIATVSNSTEEHNHHRPTYQNADGDVMPMAYEDLQGFTPAIHTYLKCNVNEEEI